MINISSSSLLYTSNNGSNETTLEDLGIFICGYIDFPQSGIDCSEKFPNICVTCKVRGGYLTDESINEFGIGHVTCRVLWYITLLVCFVGVLANFLILYILRRRKDTQSPFDYLIGLLAYADLFVCLSTSFSATTPLAYFENWYGRGQLTMYSLYVSSFTTILWRSISISVTLLITIERYMKIAHPHRSITLFTMTKTRLQALFAVFLPIVLNIPRYTSLYIAPNIYNYKEENLDIPSLRHLSHVFLRTELYSFWESAFKGAVDQVEYWIPIPLLLLFNYLSYNQVRKLSKKRKRICCNLRNDLQTARMFLPVVILLLTCNFWPGIAFVITQCTGMFYREMWMLWSLSIALNSSANFWIYYYRAYTFRCEARILFYDIATSLRISNSAASMRRTSTRTTRNIEHRRYRISQNTGWGDDNKVAQFAPATRCSYGVNRNYSYKMAVNSWDDLTDYRSS